MGIFFGNKTALAIGWVRGNGFSAFVLWPERFSAAVRAPLFCG